MISRTDGFAIPFQFKCSPLVALLSPSVHACLELSPQVTLPCALVAPSARVHVESSQKRVALPLQQYADGCHYNATFHSVFISISPVYVLVWNFSLHTYVVSGRPG
eukprot:scpid104169/ scgid7420/ 